MAELTAEETVQAADKAIHEVGSAWMTHPDTQARGAAHGYPKPMAFYFAGRGGVLGNVDAAVVTAAMGFFDPGFVRLMWDRGLAVASAREGARRYAQACADWATDHLTGFAGTDRLTELAGKVVSGAEESGLPLFAGWRAQPLADGGPARLLQLVHVLREWRGGLHLVATTAAGLRPLEAILTNEGQQQARFFGWRDELPDCEHLKDRQVQAQQTTDRLAADTYERALTPAERAEFTDLAHALADELR
ncbi:SCO6745 family protein [Actinophytocola glycyrrhizae]|uniref:EvbL n=1 Tax=Actinophytocola glycyrrhizae TaxID=2044873 RepID=A0ABV9SH13_9PSEU